MLKITSARRRLQKELERFELVPELTRATLGTGVVKVLGAGLGFGAHLVLGRYLGPDGYGVYILAWTWITVLALLSRFGFNNVVEKYLTEYQSKGEWVQAKAVVLEAVTVGLSVGGVVSLFGIVTVWLGDFMEPATTGVFVVAFVLLPVVVANSLGQSILRGLKKIVISTIPELVIRHIVVMGLVPVAALTIGAVDPRIAMWVTVIGFLAAVCVTAAFIWKNRTFRQDVWGAEAEGGGEHWLDIALPFLVISATGLLQRRADIVTLGALASSTELGYYAAGFRLSTLVGFGLVAVNTAFRPYFSQLYATNKQQALERVVALAALLTGLFTIGVGALTIIYGKDLLGLFGSQFSSAYLVLVILCGGQIVGAVTGPVATLLTMTGQQQVTARIDFGSGVANVILNVLLVPVFGAVGAAGATAATLSVRNIVMAYISYDRLGINATVLNPRLLEYLRRKAASC